METTWIVLAVIHFLTIMAVIHFLTIMAHHSQMHSLGGEHRSAQTELTELVVCIGVWRVSFGCSFGASNLIQTNF